MARGRRTFELHSPGQTQTFLLPPPPHTHTHRSPSVTDRAASTSAHTQLGCIVYTAKMVEGVLWYTVMMTDTHRRGQSRPGAGPTRLLLRAPPGGRPVTRSGRSIAYIAHKPARRAGCRPTGDWKRSLGSRCDLRDLDDRQVSRLASSLAESVYCLPLRLLF
jgi:hypothetical protein